MKPEVFWVSFHAALLAFGCLRFYKESRANESSTVSMWMILLNTFVCVSYMFEAVKR